MEPNDRSSQIFGMWLKKEKLEIPIALGKTLTNLSKLWFYIYKILPSKQYFKN